MFLRLACTTLTITALSGCADTAPAPEPGWQALPTATVIPVTSFVIPQKDDMRRGALDAHVEAVLAGEDVHDDVYRRPSTASGVLRVDCPNTRSLGLTFLLERIDKTGAGDTVRDFGAREWTSLRFQWRHSSFEAKGDKYGGLKYEVGVRTGTGGRWFHHRMKLEDIDKVDGTWTVAVSDDGVLLYEERFLLEGCSDPQHAGHIDEQASNSGD